MDGTVDGKAHEEHQYLDLLRDIRDNGTRKSNRTGIDTIGVIGRTMRFDLSDNTFPLLTTKRTWFKGIAHELLWFIAGDTNIKYLDDNGVKIWNGNAEDFWKKVCSRKEELSERADKIHEKIGNLTQLSVTYNVEGETSKVRELLEQIEDAQVEYYETVNEIDWMEDISEGDLGPVYGSQWRNFNAQGCDQLQNAINTIRNNPDSRRIIVSAWNPLVLDRVALPPCHCFFQFFVEGDDLSCLMYQRSCDTFLGVPFNIASYALLTHLVAAVTDKKAKEFIHVLGDTHLYVNHLDQVEEQLKRGPYPFPKIKINPNVKEITDFKFEDIEVVGYESHPPIKAEMAV